MNDEEQEYLTPEEVAEKLRVKKQTVINWVNEGIMPGKKLGGVIRIHQVDFREAGREPEKKQAKYGDFFSKICREIQSNYIEHIYGSSRIMYWAAQSDYPTELAKTAFIIHGPKESKITGILYVRQNGTIRFRWAQSGQERFTKKTDSVNEVLEKIEECTGIDPWDDFEREDAGGWVHIPARNFADDQAFEGLKKWYEWFLVEIQDWE